MTGREDSGLGRRLLLEALLPMGWLNVPALATFPLLFALLSRGRLDPDEVRIWVVMVWTGATVHVLVLASHTRWWAHSLRSWEMAYATVSGVNGTIWASFLLIDRIGADFFAVDMLLLAFLMVTSAATVVTFAGSRPVGRAYLGAQWTVWILVMIGRSAVGLAFLGAAVLIGAVGYHRVLHWILARTVEARVRASELADELSVQAATDPLTGLFNRSALVAAIDDQLDRSGAITLLFIDLDGFKDVNDGLGHARGDEVLVTVADRLRGVLRTGDVVGRLGGDEFVIGLTGGIDTNGVDGIVERITTSVAEPIGESPPVRVTASVGIAESGEAISTEDILGRADLAMYTAKGSGGHGARYYELGQADRRRDQLALARALPGAIANGGVVPFAQPIVRLDSGRAVAYELLARWIRPDGTLIPPDRFVPLAEDLGLDRELGCLMLDRAAAAAADVELVFGVNITVAHLLSGHLYDDVAAALGRYGTPGSRLVIEITESQVLTDLDRACHELHGLGDLGVQVAIDDFGTGSSSLAVVERLPAHYLKIAPELAMRLESSDRALVVVRCIRELATALGFMVLAEGIETQRVANLVASSGVQVGQGFHFARPMPLAHVVASATHVYPLGGPSDLSGQGPRTPTPAAT